MHQPAKWWKIRRNKEIDLLCAFLCEWFFSLIMLPLLTFNFGTVIIVNVSMLLTKCYISYQSQ